MSGMGYGSGHRCFEEAPRRTFAKQSLFEQANRQEQNNTIVISTGLTHHSSGRLRRRSTQTLDLMDDTSILIDACKYLYLQSITEPGNGGLRIVIQEAKAGVATPKHILASEALPELRAILAQSNVIGHGPECSVFEISWPSYIAYAVENESYAQSPTGDVKRSGRLFVEYSKSAYLEYVSKASFASALYPEGYKHWAVLCLDHIVNVVAVEAPIVSATEV